MLWFATWQRLELHFLVIIGEFWVKAETPQTEQFELKLLDTFSNWRLLFKVFL